MTALVFYSSFGNGAIVEEGLDSNAVVRVSNKDGKLFLHGVRGKLENTVELFPELFFSGLGTVGVEFNGIKSKSIHNSKGGLETWVSSNIFELSSASHDVDGERRMSGHANPFAGSIGISLRNLSSFDGLSKGATDRVLTVVLPNTAVVRLIDDLGSEFVREAHVFLLDDLRSKLTKSLVFSSELFAAFFSGSVNAESNARSLISGGERMKDALSLSTAVRVLEHVASMSVPGGLGLFVVEKTGSETLAPLLLTEMLEEIRFLAFSSELSRSPFGMEIVHGVVPSLARVSIEVPAVLLFSGSPVRDSESLEQGTGLTVESNITDTLEESGGMEVLSIKMMHNIWFLVELLVVDVLHTHANFSGFLYVETIGNKEEIRMNEFHRVGNGLFNPVAGVEYELNPSLVTSLPDVVLNWSANHAFTEQRSMDQFVSPSFF